MKKVLRVLPILLVILLLFTACTSSEILEIVSNNKLSTSEPVKVEDVIPLKVMTFNVFNLDDGNKLTEIANEIIEVDPDIIFVQELDVNVKRSDKQNLPSLLAEIIKMNYMFAPALKLQGGSYGVAIYSKYELLSLSATLLESGKEEQRVLAGAQIDVGGVTIQLYSSHLSFENIELRTGQLKTIQRTLEASVNAKNPVIFGADLNITSFDEISALEEKFHVVNNRNTSFATFGDPTDNENTYIDNIVMSNDFDVLHVEMIESKYSDHHMLVANIVIKRSVDVETETSESETTEGTDSDLNDDDSENDE